ncbi:hypothetical protein CLV59_107349 [Chitinophaga dinghuensis]|uniref:DUF4595 domain-containing protein n=2 Tax=Chitinophaga dinghuensis TaxID=1539050 RepID=A0A327W0L3_9BACT|nr:hypothetical protein CLV59_107349 [Chitinophaga dinghuensis]
MQGCILTGAVAMLSLFSCSKKDDKNPPTTQAQKYVSSISYLYGPKNAIERNYSFRYDTLKHVTKGTRYMYSPWNDIVYTNEGVYTDGKLSSIKGSNSNDVLYTKKFEYSANNITVIRWFDVSNQLFQVDSLFYDGKSQPQRIYTYRSDDHINLYLFEKQTGEYNNNGNMVAFKSDTLDINSGKYVTYLKEDFVYDDHPSYFTPGILPFMNEVKLPMYSKNNPREATQYWGINMSGTTLGGILINYDKEGYPNYQLGNVFYIGSGYNVALEYAIF